PWVSWWRWPGSGGRAFPRGLLGPTRPGCPGSVSRRLGRRTGCGCAWELLWGHASPAHDAGLLDAEPGDAHFDQVAGLNVARRLHPVGDARRRPRREDVARAQRHEAADVGHEVTDAEDHVRRLATLARFAVDGRPELERLGVPHLVGGDEPRPDRREGVGAL